MPRIKNTRDTLIYWLLDTRPEKMAKWPFGEPFYCGKTVHSPKNRLHGHRRNASLYPDRATSKRIVECDEHLTMETMEIVPASNDWVAREKHWIKILRHSFDATNIADGGGGVPGWIPSADAISRSTAAKLGKPRSAETRAKISVALKGRKCPSPSPEHRAKIGAANKGRVVSPEHITKMTQAAAAAKRGKSHSPEHAARISQALKGISRGPMSAEHRAKISAGNMGRSPTVETRAKLSAINTGKKHSVETRAKMSAARKDRVFGPRGPYKKRSTVP